jgi:GNAT superfamily N-acetyltransferase
MTYWKEQARETTKHCFFGLFQYKRMVGVLAAEKSKHHRSVVFYGSYALPEYRGQSLMRPLYETREKWCKDHGYRKAELFIVKGNTRSREIFLKRGAKRTHTRSMRFSGGPKASWDWYKLAL